MLEEEKDKNENVEMVLFVVYYIASLLMLTALLYLKYKIFGKFTLSCF